MDVALKQVSWCDLGTPLGLPPVVPSRDSRARTRSPSPRAWRLFGREAQRGPQVTPGDLFQSHIHLEVTHVLTKYHLAQQRISDHSSKSGLEAKPGMPASPRDTWLGSRGKRGACVQESARRGALDSPFKGTLCAAQNRRPGLMAADFSLGATSIQLWGRQPSPQAQGDPPSPGPSS